MTNREFDDIIKRLLEEINPAFDPDTWDAMEDRIEQDARDLNFDEAMRNSIHGIGASEASDWDAMEELLAAEESDGFDDTVKKEVEEYEEPFDAATWPVLKEKIVEDERRRRDLMIAKVLEVAAVLLAIFTFFNVWPEIKEDLRKNDRVEQEQIQTVVADAPLAEPQGTENSVLSNTAFQAQVETQSGTSIPDVPENLNPGTSAGQEAEATTFLAAREVEIPSILPSSAQNARAVQVEPLLAHSYGATNSVSEEIGEQVASRASSGVEAPPAAIATNNSGLDLAAVLSAGGPAVSPQLRRNGIRFNLVASFDFNSLYMPAQQFYADGYPIYFEEKTLLATGWSSGATVLFDNGPISFETGLMYSMKSYEPNRILKIGQTFDIKTIDFERIEMHMVHIPANVHWNFDRQGRTRFYVMGGAGINFVATAHYDLIVENDLRNSAPAGSRPTNNREVQQIREHFLDGAEFRSKSFITLHAGFGVDHKINEKFSVFLQPLILPPGAILSDQRPCWETASLCFRAIRNPDQATLARLFVLVEIPVVFHISN